MSRKTDEGLNDRQRLFVEEYLADLNQTQAAIRAGFSPKTAKQKACNMMKKPNIREAVDKAMAERSKRTGINADRVLLELGRCGLYNALDFINAKDATVMDNATADDGAAIASVKVKTTPTENGNIVEREIKLVDKLKALELAGRHLGMFIDKTEHSGPGGGAIPVAVEVEYVRPKPET